MLCDVLPIKSVLVFPQVAPDQSALKSPHCCANQQEPAFLDGHVLLVDHSQSDQMRSIVTYLLVTDPHARCNTRTQEQRAEAAELVAARMFRLEQRAEAAELLATERGKQVTALQQRIDSAGSQVAERAKQMAVFKERAERAKFLADQRTKQVMFVECRGYRESCGGDKRVGLWVRYVVDVVAVPPLLVRHTCCVS